MFIMGNEAGGLAYDRAAFWAAAREWMLKRDLGVLGVVTFVPRREEHRHNHEQLWLIRDTVGAQVDEGRVELRGEAWTGHEASKELRLEMKDFASFGTPEEAQTDNSKVKGEGVIQGKQCGCYP
ncbi:hypothetical protein FIBSPDRAFT_926240 [Athelia psychrophila]|uniref:Uncharacterized protein n=1 Tax=Athelia psychrophila TaxID=1759441 RepID=A0A166TMK5_9AGAM|nr:hypothetical protein FIBSPDRAFT_926240 [Fibularhizoctonia sp. CBS 109695]